MNIYGIHTRARTHPEEPEDFNAAVKRQNTAQSDDTVPVMDATAHASGNSLHEIPILDQFNEASRIDQLNTRWILSRIHESSYEDTTHSAHENHAALTKRQNTTQVDDSVLMMDVAGHANAYTLPLLDQFQEELARDRRETKLRIAKIKGGNTHLHEQIFMTLASGNYYDTIHVTPDAVNQPNNDGKTPLALAAIGQSIPLIEYLLHSGADMRYLTPEDFYCLLTSMSSLRFECYYAAYNQYLSEAAAKYNTPHMNLYLLESNALVSRMLEELPI